MASTNEYMLNLHKTLLERKDKEGRSLSDTTVSAYLKTLFMLNDKKPFKSLTFLKKTEDVEKKIVAYAESTKKTIYASVASVLSLYKHNPAYKATHKYYYDKMMDKAKEAEKIDTAEKTETQDKNWIGWGQVEQKKNELSENVLKFVKTKKISPTEYGHLLKHLVLSLYVDVPPRRNQDYLDMFVVTPTKKFVEDKDKNYLVMDKKSPKELVFNKYKTSKKYGRQTIAIPDTLKETIVAYLKHRPTTSEEKKAKTYPLLISQDGKPINQTNAITRIMNSVFGKNIGSSMLRHIYLSSKMDIAGMKADANAMGHSLNEQQKYLKSDAPTDSESSED